MDFVQRFAAVTFGTLLMVFSVAFVSIPYSLSGHPGDVLASPKHPATSADQLWAPSDSLIPCL